VLDDSLEEFEKKRCDRRQLNFLPATIKIPGNGSM
jgi:hypothetical protein